VFNSFASLAAAFTFYTCVPTPPTWRLDFSRIARWAPLVGICLGAWLSEIDLIWQYLGMPALTRSALVVVLWLWSTGGLHLDGAMDGADGLAVQQPERRLAVMSDSVAGAFGVMAAIAILMLKVCALVEIDGWRWWALIAAAGWSRWGQVMAIALYPYLKAEGKGAFHKQGMKLPQDIVLGLIGLSVSVGLRFYLQPESLATIGWQSIGCITIPVAVGYYFFHRLGGHTGDTYGAVVEWSEVLILVWLAAFGS
jgi:adenosylcobinamide-GDP ribazoletransferase